MVNLQTSQQPSYRVYSTPAPQFGMVGNTAQHVAPELSRLAQVAKASGHYGNIVVQHEKALKYMTAIVASLLLVISRIFTAWTTAFSADEGEDRKFATKEAYRTTLRELGGFTFSYALLKVLEKKTSQKLLRSVGLGEKKPQTRQPLLKANLAEPPHPGSLPASNTLPSISQATRQWIGNLKAISRGEFNEKQANPSKIYRAEDAARLEHGNYTNFSRKYHNNPLFRRWVNLFQPETWKSRIPVGIGSNFINAGKTPIELFKPFLKNSPMVVGGATALALSGFFLEWLTLNKMDAITGFLSGHKPETDTLTGKSRVPLPPPVNPYSPGASVLAPRLIEAHKSPEVLTSWDVYSRFSQPYDNL